MKKILVGTLTCLFGAIAGHAQQDPVLMRINGQDITRSEFERFCHRNKPSGIAGKETLKRCADLFVDMKLKLSAAQKAGLDTVSDFRTEMENYHRALSRSYLTDSATDEAYAKKLYDQMKTRSAAGEVKVMRIFRYLPQIALPHHLREAQILMDSLYHVLETHPDIDFRTLVNKYSDDKKEFWMGWLQTSQEFEEVAFSLKDGEYSKPFFTPKGIQIIKVTGRREIPPFEQIRGELIHKLSRRPGTDKEIELWVNKLKSTCQYTPDKAGMEELLALGRTSRTLFTLDGKSFTGKDFERFADAHPMGIKRQLNAFVVKSILDYENNRLEQKYPDFRLALQQRRDDLLLAAITRRESRQVSLSDSVALKAFFKEHRTDYNWDSPRYRGAVLHGTHKKTLKSARKFLKKLPEEE
ncbi:PPIC-type PPIASE domain protein [Bacteroides fragilis str. 20793-3]|nr:PPIC-type PPIASE domain protein [Bacteroides fragilis str. 20793-3]